MIIYRNSDINIDGQLQACKEFDAHPEWLLRNTTGGVVGTQQWYDFTAPGMSDWWINSTIDALTDICKQARCTLDTCSVAVRTRTPSNHHHRIWFAWFT